MINATEYLLRRSVIDLDSLQHNSTTLPLLETKFGDTVRELISVLHTVGSDAFTGGTGVSSYSRRKILADAGVLTPLDWDRNTCGRYHGLDL